MTTAVRLRGPVCGRPFSPPCFAGLDFSLERGELLCLAGANGSGKSTLLGLLAGLHPCAGGRLTVLGEEFARAGGAPAAARRIALLPQNADAYILGATPFEDLGITADGRAPDPAAARSLAAAFGLEAYLHQPVAALSYGQKRKLCLASALLADPELLLLDEPLSGLDYPAAEELVRRLADFRARGLTLVASSHDLQALLPVTDKLLLLSETGESLFGPPAELLAHLERFGVRPVGLNT